MELTTNAQTDLLVDHDIYVAPYTHTHVCSNYFVVDRLSLDAFVSRSQLKPLVLNRISGKNLISDLVSLLCSVSKLKVAKLLRTDVVRRISCKGGRVNISNVQEDHVFKVCEPVDLFGDVAIMLKD